MLQVGGSLMSSASPRVITDRVTSLMLLLNKVKS